jgi:hypothetical protein
MFLFILFNGFMLIVATLAFLSLKLFLIGVSGNELLENVVSLKPEETLTFSSETGISIEQDSSGDEVEKGR